MGSPCSWKQRWAALAATLCLALSGLVLGGPAPVAHAAYRLPAPSWINFDQYEQLGAFHIWVAVQVPGTTELRDQHGTLRCSFSRQHRSVEGTCDFPDADVAADIVAHSEWTLSHLSVAGVMSTRHFIVGQAPAVKWLQVKWLDRQAQVWLGSDAAQLIVRNHLGEQVCDVLVKGGYCEFIPTHPDGIFEYTVETVDAHGTHTITPFWFDKNLEPPRVFVDDFELAAEPGQPVELSGETEPGAMVYVSWPGHVTGCWTWAGADGRWSCPPAVFPDGTSEIQVAGERVDGVYTILLLDVRIRELAPDDPPSEYGDCTIVGTSGPDVLIGTPFNDVICGLEGDDILKGNGGTDILIGGPGKDKLYGGPGDDILDGGDGNDRLTGDDGADALDGGSGNDLIAGGNGNDTLDGGPGKDTETGGKGDDIVNGGGDNDRLSGGLGDDDVRGQGGNDVMAAASGDDRMWGGSGNDQAYGDPGDDDLWGGPGNDRLSAASGDDRLSGDEGNDTLAGGAGSDQLDGGSDKDRCQREKKASDLQNCE